MRKAVISALSCYKRWLSPLLPTACRYHPTCSEYMADAVAKYGVFLGTARGLARLARCHPFASGGYDPVR